MAKRKFKGIVISTANSKTIAVKVQKHKKNAQYGKTQVIYKKYMAHDENEIAKIGDLVTIEESHPISKTKKWLLIENK